MQNTKRTAVRKPRQRLPVNLVVSREFIGDADATAAIIPVIVDDIRRKAEEIRTFDSDRDTA